MGDTGDWNFLKQKYAIQLKNNGANIIDTHDHAQISLSFKTSGTDEILSYLQKAI